MIKHEITQTRAQKVHTQPRHDSSRASAVNPPHSVRAVFRQADHAADPQLDASWRLAAAETPWDHRATDYRPNLQWPRASGLLARGDAGRQGSLNTAASCWSLQDELARTTCADGATRVLVAAARRGALKQVDRLDLASRLTDDESFSEFLAGEERLEKIMSSSNFSNLEELDLTSNYAPCFQVLVKVPGLKTLQRLSLASTFVGSAGAQVIAAASFPNLTHLNLTASYIGDEGALALSKTEGFPMLRRLILRDNMIGDDARSALETSACLAAATIIF